MAQILTTHVGSLPRSQDVVDLLFARENGRPYDPAAFDGCMADAVADSVARQVTAGIDIVSDGEMSKISYATYIKDRYTGFSGDSPRKAPADLKLFPTFLAKLSATGDAPKYDRPLCTGQVRPKNTDELDRDIINLRHAMARQGVARGFMNAASPGVVSLFLHNAHYPTRDDYLAALADAMKPEYEAIVSAGLDLQIDCPDLALARHMIFADKSDDEFVAIAETHVEVLNHALRDIDPARVRIHICWGNYEGPHVCDISMAKILPAFLRARGHALVFEAANPRHAHEWKIIEARMADIPGDKVLVPGLIDSTTNFVEHPELVAQRIELFAGIAGPDRVIAGTDCGFGTFAGFGAVDGEIAYAKLAALAQGVALANARL